MICVAISFVLIGIPLPGVAQTSPNPAPSATPEIIFAENFDHAILRHALDEFDSNPGVVDWTTPEDSGLGWTCGADRAFGGTREWLGWSITNLQFWSGDDDQGRLGVFSGNTEAIFAVADSDEAEDGRQTPDDGYNVYLRSPIIPLAIHWVCASKSENTFSSWSMVSSLRTLRWRRSKCLSSIFKKYRICSSLKSCNGYEHAFSTCLISPATFCESSVALLVSFRAAFCCHC